MLIIYAYSFSVRRIYAKNVFDFGVCNLLPVYCCSQKIIMARVLRLTENVCVFYVMKDFLLSCYVALDEYQCIQVISCSLQPNDLKPLMKTYLKSVAMNNCAHFQGNQKGAQLFIPTDFKYVFSQQLYLKTTTTKDVVICIF